MRKELLKDFPIRADTHISESQSLIILRRTLPSSWVIRDVGERDYGLDLYVEIVGEDKRLRGDLVAIQVKSQKAVKFSQSTSGQYTTVRSIKRATLNYWLAMPVPVFLSIVCLSSERCYWSNIKRQHREGAYLNKTNPTIRINGIDTFSTLSDQNRFLKSYEIECKWPEIEVAIEKCLTSFTSMGPLVLMCKRGYPNQPCSTTLQYLINSHWQIFQTLSMHLMGKPRKNLSYWYEENTHYSDAKRLPKSYTFYYHIAFSVFKAMQSAYRECIITAYEMVTNTHKEYFEQRFPLLRSHLQHRPLTFLADDWYPRYFFDEFESETKFPEKLFFEDFDEYDNILENLTRT